VPDDGGPHPDAQRILGRVGEQRPLTSFSHGAGCGCKLGPDQLSSVLSGLALPSLPDEVLVASDTGDDAAVVRLADGRALVATLDFFTPIVDDPYDWGRIAATNALSDVYAMGAAPLLVLNIVAWPVDDLPLEVLGQVLQGGIDVATKAGAVVAGGHSITDPEPKYGMAALGLADPGTIVRNSTLVPDAELYLTKPLGLGVISTAIKRGVASAEQVRAAVEVMTTLNDAASEAMLEAGAVAATDVTGFGLLGHLHRMALSSGCAAVVDASAVELLPGALDLARSDVVPGGTKRNLAHVRPHTAFGDLTEPERAILADAQTSGGLLLAATDAASLEAALAERGVRFARVGRSEAGEAGAMRVEGRLPGS
jgi:selenide,water dikinase